MFVLSLHVNNLFKDFHFHPKCDSIERSSLSNISGNHEHHTRVALSIKLVNSLATKNKTERVGASSFMRNSKRAVVHTIEGLHEAGSERKLFSDINR